MGWNIMAALGLAAFVVLAAASIAASKAAVTKTAGKAALQSRAALSAPTVVRGCAPGTSAADEYGRLCGLPLRRF
jgi:hypothetical protein